VKRLLLVFLTACRATSAPVAVTEHDSGAPPLPMIDAAIEAAAPEPRDASVADAAPPEGMLLVPGGTFTMGADTGGEGDERPAHSVTIASFWLDRTEVTQSAYEACTSCTPADPEILATFSGVFKGPNKPVVGISWFSARDYCRFLGKRLPREAEFERAVRGDDGRRFPWGNDTPTPERAVFSTNYPDEVGSRPKGKGPYGHDDLAGNVWEWIDDDYDPFAYTRATAAEGKPGSCDEILAAQNKLRAEGKQGFTGTNPIPTECEKAIRGGAYNYPAAGLRSTNRVHHPARFKLRMTGVRCAKDA
jgi:formylglycine-generating enzyme required for sulfatase activity